MNDSTTVACEKKIGKMIAAGDCEGAAKLAYEKGWLETGAEIKRNCTASETPEDTAFAWVDDYVRDLRREIGDKIALGDCEGAVKLAYEKGGSAIGAQTEQTCRR